MGSCVAWLWHVAPWGGGGGGVRARVRAWVQALGSKHGFR